LLQRIEPGLTSCSPMSVDQAATLVTAAKAGNDHAFTGLLEIVLEPGYKLACGMLHDPQAAEDAVQEAALKAWRKLGQLREGQALRPWFLSIVANECREIRRSRWWSVQKWPETPTVEESSPEGVVRGMELRRALRTLGRDKRLVLVLHWYLDLPLSEIALITGATVHAVEARLNRGIHELRRKLEEEK
jgi:RNA polymerase sigma factor (sigma-70 family)